jgi:hypothetical protein
MTLGVPTRAGGDQELREAMLTGRLVDWRTGNDVADDPAHGAGWDAQRTVASTLLIELLTEAKGPRRLRALRLAGARIVGQLDLEAIELACPLLLDDCWFAEPLVLDEAQAPTVRLVGCHLPGLSANQLTTRGDFGLHGSTVTGEVSLKGARIGGILDLEEATLTNMDGLALSADGLTVGQAMFCRDGFSATGQVSLAGAHIGGQLRLDWATLTNPDGRALDLQELRTEALLLRDLAKPPAMILFTHARIGTLVDEPASWPRQTVLDGFVYDALFEVSPVTARQRLGWLTNNPLGYRPQPYEQLAAVYRRAGRDHDARTIAIAKQRARRRTLNPPERLWSLLLDGLVGYGYRTWMAAVWLLGFWLVGWAVFDRAHSHRDMVLAKPTEAHPGFHGAIYSLDTLLPVVDLRQQDVWIPRGAAQWWAWASIVVGWILTTAVIAALTGLLKRD